MAKEEKKEKSKAEEIAEIMIANMIANMKNPNFIEEREQILQEAAKKANAELRNSEDETEVSKENENS